MDGERREEELKWTWKREEEEVVGTEEWKGREVEKRRERGGRGKGGAFHDIVSWICLSLHWQ